MVIRIARDILFADVFQSPKRFFKLRLVIGTGGKQKSKKARDCRHHASFMAGSTNIRGSRSFDFTPYGVTLRMTHSPFRIHTIPS